MQHLGILLQRRFVKARGNSRRRRIAEEIERKILAKLGVGQPAEAAPESVEAPVSPVAEAKVAQRRGA